MDPLRNLKATPLSPEKLKAFYKKETNKELKVVMLNSIKEGDTIEAIFDQGCFVLFIPVMSSFNGHFVSLFRTREGIFFLDSYANTPKNLFKTIEELGKVQLKTQLFEIIRNSEEHCYYNPILYQSKTEQVADCGRFAVVNCILFTKHQEQDKQYNLVTFNNKIIEFMKTHQIADYDDAITALTQNI